jgi:Rps23 Pro-64 3,4-dihydroxylase Tpa1-like proline 4-hydroxylase
LVGDELAAQKWRWDTLRLLSHIYSPQLSEQALEMVHQAAREETEVFLKSSISCLLNRNRVNEYTKDIHRIFKPAAETAYDGWRERYFIRCRTLADCAGPGAEGDSWDKHVPLEAGTTLANELHNRRVVLFIRPRMEIVEYFLDETAGGHKQERQKSFLLSDVLIWSPKKDE